MKGAERGGGGDDGEADALRSGGPRGEARTAVALKMYLGGVSRAGVASFAKNCHRDLCVARGGSIRTRAARHFIADLVGPSEAAHFSTFHHLLGPGSGERE